MSKVHFDVVIAEETYVYVGVLGREVDISCNQAYFSMDNKETEVIEQFVMLMEKSRSLFDGLRDLPQFCHSHWQSHFGKAFDVYTKLWKFQQENRSVLDKHYNLRRWQIGEIASKIGQLYYHYYLRTSETNYLFEAYQFYSAIRSRNYFGQDAKETENKLLSKKLRYYARFLVVSLLLNETELVRDLIKELKRLVNEYAKAEGSSDQSEWQLVLKEAISFIEAENIITVLEDDLSICRLKHRIILEKIPNVGLSENFNVKLKEVLIIGNCEKQTKFSELTLDMFRFLQCVEKMPGSLESYTMKITSSGVAPEQVDQGQSVRKNPHKYILYKPSFGQLITFIGAAYKDLPTNGVMLLYLSADASFHPKKTTDDYGFYNSGGVATKKPKSSVTKKNVKESNCLYPEDIIPFTRKPLMIIVDCSNAKAFTNLPKLFGQPLMCLMSPSLIPEKFESKNIGGLLTLFLYEPLLAFSIICNTKNIRKELWDKCQQCLDKIFAEILEILYSFIKELDLVFEQYLEDEFIRLLIIRFIFCYETLRLHTDFKDSSYYPQSLPSICMDVFNHKGFARHVLELASLLDVRNTFHELTEVLEMEAISLM